MMKKYIPIFLISFLMGQYNYSLEDINPSSAYYGSSVGTEFFQGKVTLHYFGHYT